MFGYSSNIQIPPVTRNLLIVNILVFVATLVNENAIVSAFALFYPTSQYFHFWQPVTYMFVHGGFWHIFFNMYTLFIFGCVIENIIGSKKFLLLYFVCGIGSALIHLGVEYAQAQSFLNQLADGSRIAAQKYAQLKVTPTVGASGAIYGVLISYAMLFPDARLTLIFPPIPMKARTWILVFIAIEVFTGVTGTVEGVAHFAHLGGMLTGFLMILYWRKKGTLFERDEW